MCAKSVFLGSCAICVSHIATSPLLHFLGLGLMGNLNFTQHITRDSRGMVTQFCLQESLFVAKMH